MKIVFLTHMSDQGHRFRVEQYFPFLRAHDLDPTWQPFSGTMKERLAHYRDLASYDVVCIQRRLFSPYEFHVLRKHARRILFDLDDAIMYRSSSSSFSYSFSRRFKFRRMVKGSDQVTVGNQFLKEEVLRVDPRKKVEVIPTCIDTSLYPRKKTASEGTEFVLGWIGTKGNLRYLRMLEPVFEEVGRRFPSIRLKIVSNDFYDPPSLPVIKKPWRLEDENEDLLSFDTGLMPLSQDPWSRGKCGLKIIQYLSVGIPVVCTPVGINRDIVRDGVNGFWATTAEEWVDRIARLLRDRDLRQKMGRRGIETVEEGYSLSVVSEKFYAVLRDLIRQNGGTG